jgi:hypothetical protein
VRKLKGLRPGKLGRSGAAPVQEQEEVAVCMDFERFGAAEMRGGFDSDGAIFDSIADSVASCGWGIIPA